MKLAIMQPYFLPYIGYWQLIHAVDRFVIYDDVTYIKGGWINRNRLLINGKPTYITVPLVHASSYKYIYDTILHPSLNWRKKLLKTIRNTYRKTAYFSNVYPIVEKLINHETNNLSDFLANQLQTLSTFMGIKTEFVLTSRIYDNCSLSGEERIIDICKRERAKTYINPEGGQTLYNSSVFRAAGMDLCFIVMRVLPYRQRSANFTPYLSIIDALMEIGPINIKNHLAAFSIVRKSVST